MAYLRAYQAMAGDPGFFKRFKIPKKLRKLKVGRALGGLAGGAVGFIPGVGPIASRALGALGGGMNSCGPQMGDPGFFGGLGKIAGRVAGAFRGGSPTLRRIAGSNVGRAIIGGVVATGAGAIAGGVIDRFSNRSSGGGSRRSMNPGNFRALNRALRRIERFEKAARRVIRVTKPGASVQIRGGFRRKRRK